MPVFASPTKDLQPVGSAKLEILFWDIYESTLYSQDGEYIPERFPVALEINYLREISADDLLERTVKEWKKLGYEDEQISQWSRVLRDLWPDVDKGDQLTLRVEPEGGGQFYFNGNAIGPRQSKQLAPNFLAIWLAENCSFPKLRKKLIGASR